MRPANAAPPRATRSADRGLGLAGQDGSHPHLTQARWLSFGKYRVAAMSNLSRLGWAGTAAKKSTEFPFFV